MIMSGIGVIGYGFWHFGKELPDFQHLEKYEPPVVSRVFAGDGRLMAQYAIEKRVFVPIDNIPNIIKQAFIAAEDQRFYGHIGVDFIALSRAVIANITRYIRKQRLIGASTITQQVAKNFLLTNDYSLARKVKEAILALRIERALNKKRILELYLNEIYLGQGAYGVAQASLVYFDKSLHDLTIEEAAFLAALPKAPNNYHPIRKKKAAISRRNWVIARMRQEGYIDVSDEQQALTQPLNTRTQRQTIPFEAGYFLEEVRKELVAKHSVDVVLQQGLSIHTNLEPHMQQHAEASLQQGLRAYDRRHGYRGVLANLPISDAINDELLLQFEKYPQPNGIPNHYDLALVTHINNDDAEIIIQSDLSIAYMDLKSSQWARSALANGKTGKKIKHLQQIINIGDIIIVSPQKDKTYNDMPLYQLEQIPNIEGAIVVMNPHNGKIYAMSGGWSFEKSKFNRATQAMRQPGSALKPIIYLAALEDNNSDYHPGTLVLDAPIVIDQGVGLPKWKPANYSKQYYGLTPMRVGIEKSRNLMTIRLALDIGMAQISDLTTKMGIYDRLPLQYSMALGAGETTLMRLVRAYAMLVNGGKDIQPSFIDRASDRYANIILKHDQRQCDACITNNEFQPPILPDQRTQLFDARSAFQVTSMMEGVVQRGTGRRIKTLGIPLAGKTGTTNDSYDAWFVGFAPDLVVGIYTGFDQPRSLGHQRNGVQETGSNVAAPIFKEFMARTLAKKEPIPFRTPSGLTKVKINRTTGEIANNSDDSKDFTNEFLKTEQLKKLSKTNREPQLDGIY